MAAIALGLFILTRLTPMLVHEVSLGSLLLGTYTAAAIVAAETFVVVARDLAGVPREGQDWHRAAYHPSKQD